MSLGEGAGLSLVWWLLEGMQPRSRAHGAEQRKRILPGHLSWREGDWITSAPPQPAASSPGGTLATPGSRVCPSPASTSPGEEGAVRGLSSWSLSPHVALGQVLLSAWVGRPGGPQEWRRRRGSPSSTPDLHRLLLQPPSPSICGSGWGSQDGGAGAPPPQPVPECSKGL